MCLSILNLLYFPSSIQFPEKKVIQDGEACLRVNENGVDLNRNYDFGWKRATIFQDKHTHPGKTAFSEFQTRLIKDTYASLGKTQHVTFLDIHAGMKGMLRPEFNGMKNREKMITVLEKLNESHCHCKIGKPMEVVGYDSVGTSDAYFAARQEADFSFTFEIYGGPQKKWLPGNEKCLNIFTPSDEETYTSTLVEWSQVYLETAKIIYELGN